MGSDEAGKITLPDEVSTCTLTFSAPWPNAPACVAVNARPARHKAEHPLIARGLHEELPGAFEPIHEERVAQANVDDILKIRDRRVDLRRDVDPRRRIHANAANLQRAAKEPVPRDGLVQLEQALANPEAMRLRDGEAGVVGNRANVRDVVVDPLQFEQDDAKIPRAARRLDAGRRFDRLAVRERVADSQKVFPSLCA